MSCIDAESAAPSLFQGADSDTMTTPGKGKRRSLLQEGLGDAVDQAQVSKARKLVNDAMAKDPPTALRLAYLISTNSLGKAAKGKSQMLPGCANKYSMIGKDRSIAILCRLSTKVDKDVLGSIRKEDLVTLLNFALVLDEPCAVPSKVWIQVLEAALSRYEEVGFQRLDDVVFVRKGDAKVFYTEVDYAQGGCFKLNSTMRQKVKVYTSITHCSGTTTKLTPPHGPLLLHRRQPLRALGQAGVRREDDRSAHHEGLPEAEGGSFDPTSLGRQ